MSDVEPDLKSAVHSYQGLDRAFHEKARLCLMTCIASQIDGLSFADLKQLCDLSDGNLNRHLDVLQEIGAISLERSGAGRTAKTTVRITKKGLNDFQLYLTELERVLKVAEKGLKKATAFKKKNVLRLSES